MVIYFVEINDSDNLTKLNNSVSGIDDVEFQGVLNNYRNDNGKKVALFYVGTGKPQLKFKMKYPSSTSTCPRGVSNDVHNFFNL